LAAGGPIDSLLVAIREREQHRAKLEREVERLRAMRVVDPRTAERQLRARFDEWRAMFRRQVQWSRQFLQKLLEEKIVCAPRFTDAARPEYEIRMRLSFGRVFEGIICPSGMASPADRCCGPEFRRIVRAA